MADDKTLTGKGENVVRTVERTLAAQARREQPGVKITNLASGKVQVEVHAYNDDLTAAGDAARAEFDRQLDLASVPVDELEKLRWLATIGQAAMDKGTISPSDVLDSRDVNVRDIQAGPGRRRKSVVATGDDDGAPHTPTVDALDEMMTKLREVADSGVEGAQG